MREIDFKSIEMDEKEKYIEIEIKKNGIIVGKAEVEPNQHMLARFEIFEPYQNKGYGTEALEALINEYKINNLWVRADNNRAIHVYEKCGFKKSKTTMYEMMR